MDNKESLCSHGNVHPLESRIEKCIPSSIYKYLKNILHKYWEIKKRSQYKTKKLPHLQALILPTTS